MVDLRNEASKSSRSHIDLSSAIRTPGGVDVKASQNLTETLVDSQNNLSINT
jgi:hypothetical protein